jgi:hypothetical protein
MTKANGKLPRFAKRHYEAVAEALQEAAPDSGKNDYTIKRDQWLNTVGELADMFKRDSGHFIRDRFERACVPGANVRARS